MMCVKVAQTESESVPWPTQSALAKCEARVGRTSEELAFCFQK